MRSIKLAIAAVAMTTLSGCGSFWDPVEVPAGYVGSYGTTQPTRYDAERAAHWANYRTPAGGTAAAGANASGPGPAVNAAGQCTTGVLTTCHFPGRGPGPCCAPAQ